VCDRSIITDRTIHNNRPDIVVLDKTITEAYSIDVAIPNSHNLHSTITKKLRKYTDLKEELTRIWQLKRAYIIPLVLSTTGIIPKKKIHENLKLLNLAASLYIIQKAVIFKTCRVVRKFLTEH
jgi:predicted methyltransferase MtxX (methanogen marker protein 4)